jgi:hypothetical protein
MKENDTGRPPLEGKQSTALHPASPIGWCSAALSGSLGALSKRKGRKAKRHPLEGMLRVLERERVRLERGLHKAHLIIDGQGGGTTLLGLSFFDETKS